jgi:hypothetical protein
MHYRSRWSWPLLIPLAVLHGCGAPADSSPFDGSSTTSNGGSSSGSAATATPSAPAAPTSNTTPAPASPSLSNEQVGPLPVSPVANGAGGTGGIAAAGGAGAGGTPAVTPPPTPIPPVVVGELDPLECASYETGFLPLVHQPVCSSCHTNGGGLPLFEPFAQAANRCAQIGREVASGDMPPNGRLSADQLAVVASWVSLGCPETAEDAAPLCASAANPSNPANPPAPPPPQNGGDDDDDDDGGDDDDDDDDGGDDD